MSRALSSGSSAIEIGAKHSGGCGEAVEVVAHAALDGRHGIRTMGSVDRGAAKVEAVGRAVTAAVLAAATSAVRMATAVCRDPNGT